MNALFQTQRRVEFRDTDAAGIAHFSVFFNYMEEAEHAFLRERGLTVFVQDAEGPLSWPRVSAHCDYIAPVKFEDVLDIAVEIARLGTKSVTYKFTFSAGGQPIASGLVTSVCCRFDSNGTVRSVPIPAWIRDKLTLPRSS
jgi:4-hydroxybenzoyl-CoA thioesterase/acyl-CoA thioester hydrolase